MYDGVLILESLKVGTVLSGIPLAVTKVSRVAVEGTSADQPPVWSLVEFAVERGEAKEFGRGGGDPGGATGLDTVIG
ncbi:hypothetical protein [Kribbella sindirgiensis]|uniref:Uncharacterized protein n=1 Tax=Kribbella sindirgiensis TaxID=1124744 RepID=A0A4R0IUK7_9ACTN|nr:hypothetical protein [Kribbella sindirgiensis]TCC35138.1 hypothetical protein E0H50_14845 [Kribbella sindirgiensis]